MMLDTWLSTQFLKKSDYRWFYFFSLMMLIIMLAILIWAKTLSKEIKRRKQAQKALKREKGNFKILFEKSADGNIILQNNKLVDCNQAVLDMLGFESKNQLMAAQLTDLIGLKQPDGTDSITLSKNMLSQCEKEGFARLNFLAKKTNEEKFWIDVILMPIQYNNDDAIYIIWRDISKQVELNQALIHAQQLANDANNAKSEFLANMSHEIRTPMNAIIGFTDLLYEQVSNPKHQSFIKTIKVASNNLLVLINDILDLSKIEAGKMTINKVSVNPIDLFNETCQVFAINIQNKDLGFNILIDPEFPECIMVDAIKIKQVVFNLLGNALKFTEHGYISFYAKIINKNDDLNTIDIIIEIEDTGIGIAQDQLESIFNVFEQQRGQDKNKYKGTGLGLSISKKLVENMCGTITLESKVNKGSCFTVNLPNIAYTDTKTSPTSHNHAIQTHNIHFHKSTILLVDDIHHNRELIKEFFLNTEIVIVEAENGKEAVDKVHNNPIDLVLMDIRMPIMDGIQASTLIKKSYPDLPIIALTASKLDFEANNSRQLFNSYIRKPIKKHELINILSEYLACDISKKSALKSSSGSSSVDVSNNELDKLQGILSTSITYLWEQAIKTNHFKDIQIFAESLNHLKTEFPVRILIEYVQELDQNIELYDIAELQKHLVKFTTFKDIIMQSNESTAN